MSNLISQQRFFERATDFRLLQKPALFVLISLTTIIHIVSSIDLAFTSFEIRIPLAIASMFPAIFIIFLFHKIANRFPAFRVAIILSSYLIGGLIRGWLLESGLYWFGILSPGATNFRISTGAVIVFLSAGITSYFWSTLSDARQSIIALRRETTMLQQTLEGLANEIQARDVEQSITVLQRITDELSKLTRNSLDIAQSELEHLVDQVVRPLSRNFAPKRILQSINPIPNVKLTRSGVWELLDPLRHLPSFRIIVLALAIAGAAPVRRLYGFAPAIELAVLVSVTLYLSLLVINPIAQNALLNYKSPIREIIMSFGFILVAIPPSLATTYALRNTPNPDAYLIPGIITLPIFAWILTIGNAAWEYSQNIKSNLEATRDQQRWALARLNLLSWYKNGLISRLLHGPVQNSLQVAILQIRAGDEDGKSREVIEQVINRINEAVTSSFNEVHSAQSDLVSMNSALETWRAIAAIEISHDEKSEQALISDPAGCAIFTDIVMEACSNAIRHGNSKKIKINYELTDIGIRLKISENGTWNDMKSSPGLGNELLSSCSIWFERRKHDDWNELALELPLGNQPPKVEKSLIELAN